MRTRWTIITLLLGLALSVAACAPTATPTPIPTKAPQALPTKPPAAVSTPAAATPAPKPATIKYGVVQSIGDAGVYVAFDKGYFKEQGITLELNDFRTVAEMIAPLGTGQLDAMVTPLSVPLLAAADRNVDMKIVAAAGFSLPKWEFSWVMLRKDLADSGRVKTGADLKGMKVAIPSPGAMGDQITQIILEQGGLKSGDVEIVVLPFAEQAAAFANKAIAAGWSIEPFVVRSVGEGFSVKWLPSSQFFGGKVETGVIVFGPAMAKDQDLSRRWMIGYLKGSRDYIKAFTTREGRDDIVRILTKYTTVKDPKLYDLMELPYVDPNGQIDSKSMNAQYKWFVEKGLYTGKKSFDNLVDLSYQEYAVQRLGKP